MSKPTTQQQLTEARERMHELISGDGTWQERYLQQRLINRLQVLTARERARDLELLTKIFTN